LCGVDADGELVFWAPRLNALEWALALQLAAAGCAVSGRELAGGGSRPRPSVNRSLRALAGSGLVTREPALPGRSVRWSLTADGQQVVAQNFSPCRVRRVRVMGNVTSASFAAYVRELVEAQVALARAGHGARRSTWAARRVPPARAAAA